jgi:signal transduction histidine kinase
VPLFIQLSLGTINDSGFVISWCFLGPLGSLYFLNRTSSLFWMLVFILAVCLSLVGFQPLSDDGDKVTENLRVIFYLMNTGALFIVIFISSSYFLKSLNSQKKINTSILKDAQESNKQLEASLAREKELVQLKSSFIAVASHQFRTPLAIVQSNTELLEILNTSGEKRAPGKYKKITNRISESISTMTYLMDDLLALERLNAGKLSYTPEGLDLVVFARKWLKNLIQLDDRTLDFVIDGEAYKVQLDANLLTHSLSNLISNAFNYSVEKENPKLSIHFKPTEVILTIKNYGTGFYEEQQLHLFEPFFRADNTTETKGTGLGLSISQECIELNNGTISVKSTLGEGGCFEIRFSNN